MLAAASVVELLPRFSVSRLNCFLAAGLELLVPVLFVEAAGVELYLVLGDALPEELLFCILFLRAAFSC